MIRTLNALLKLNLDSISELWRPFFGNRLRIPQGGLHSIQVWEEGTSTYAVYSMMVVVVVLLLRS